MPDDESDFEALRAIYDALPPTTCTKQSCASWCCTKLETSMDHEGRFMPLPLVYAVEYRHILKFLKRQYTDKEISRSFDFSKTSRICPFKDPQSHRCSIYPVRPFSCRVYGRKVPPVFWGVKVPEEFADHIHCPDMVVDEPQKEAAFRESYPGMWQQLADLSLRQEVWTAAKQEEMRKVTGIPMILVTAFGEFYHLTRQSVQWFKKHFATYWQHMGNKL